MLPGRRHRIGHHHDHRRQRRRRYLHHHPHRSGRRSNVTDTGASGNDQLTDNSSAAGPETIGISDTQVTRSGAAALTYSGLEVLAVKGTPAADTINITKTNAATATTVSAGTGLDIFGAIDLTQIGAAGLTIHAGGNGESLTLNTTTAGTVSVTGTTVQRSGNGQLSYDGLGQPHRQRHLRRRHLQSHRHRQRRHDHHRRQRRRRYLHDHPHRPGRRTRTSPTPAPADQINSPIPAPLQAPRPSASAIPKSPAPAAPRR